MKTKTTTSDIYFAASLLSLGAQIENVDRTDSRHMKFTITFEPTIYKFKSPDLPELTTSGPMGIEYYENLWDTGSLFVNAVRFKHAFQKMQSLIHSS